LDFYYKKFHTYSDGHVAWVTSSNPGENDSAHPRFGSAAAYFNVIDIGQSYPQHYVKLGVMAVDNDERVQRSAHLAYEKVVLTTAAATQLSIEPGGIPSEEESGTPNAIGGAERHASHQIVNAEGIPSAERVGTPAVIAMSGRRGIGVKADDLVDQLEANALAEVANRHPELGEQEQREVAHKIAVGALRYFLLKFTRNSIISFDFKEALAFDGETGPYVQYSVVRANSIFRKLTDAGIATAASDARELSRERIGELLSGEAGDELWSIIYLAERLADVVRGAVAALEPAIIAKWTFQLAQRYNIFYHNYHILSEQDADRRALLVAITSVVRRQLIRALDVLGIEAPERM
jgi:arginyl-tRNA synthetase